MAPPTDGDGGCPEPFDTILFVDVDPRQTLMRLAREGPCGRRETI